jgi:hypothetical protein
MTLVISADKGGPVRGLDTQLWVSPEESGGSLENLSLLDHVAISDEHHGCGEARDGPLIVPIDTRYDPLQPDKPILGSSWRWLRRVHHATIISDVGQPGQTTRFMLIGPVVARLEAARRAGRADRAARPRRQPVGGAGLAHRETLAAITGGHDDYEAARRDGWTDMCWIGAWMEELGDGGQPSPDWPETPPPPPVAPIRPRR